jgi:hypothetical protein
VFTTEPTLVTVEPGVYVVQDADYPTYYIDDTYWVFRDNIWYRSTTYEGGWVVAEVNVVPPRIVSRDHKMFVHYHAAAGVETRPAPKAPATAAAAGAAPAGEAKAEPPGHENAPPGLEKHGHEGPPGLDKDKDHDKDRDAHDKMMMGKHDDDHKADVDKKHDSDARRDSAKPDVDKKADTDKKPDMDKKPAAEKKPEAGGKADDDMMHNTNMGPSHGSAEPKPAPVKPGDKKKN